MEYIIGAIVIVIGLFIIGFILKKKNFKEIDRLEKWKMDIMNRPVLEEMSKVKQLNMTGQTEELFERWRSEWDDIVTVKLPNVEEFLFDAEEFIDKYRFRKAKEVQGEIEKYLADIEDKIKILLSELNELVGSEEKNRVEAEDLKDHYRESKKHLLAHHHTYGKAADLLEKELEGIYSKFEDFDVKTEMGNYLEARELVMTIKLQMNELDQKMEAIPNLLAECQSKIPAQLKDLKEGYKEMAEQGYILDHIEVEKEAEKLLGEMAVHLGEIEEANISNALPGIEEIKDRVNTLYDLLEEEVHSKHFIIQQDPVTRNMLFANLDTNRQLKEEVAFVQQSYHISEKDAQIQAELDKKLVQLNKRFETLEYKILAEGTAYSFLKAELEEIKNQLEEVTEEHAKFQEKLQALRKDELAARESVAELKKRIAECVRLVSKSNVPGLPQDYQYLLEDARESIGNVIEKLNEKPLDTQIVQQYLELAVLTVNKAVKSSEEMIDTIMLAEKVIQYGNRYRSRYSSVEKGLQEAEESFRGFDYKTALEQAAAAIEKVDPSAMRKIEAILNEDDDN